MAAKITTIEHLRDLATTVEGFTANLVGDVAEAAAEAIEAVEGTVNEATDNDKHMLAALNLFITLTQAEQRELKTGTDEAKETAVNARENVEALKKDVGILADDYKHVLTAMNLFMTTTQAEVRELKKRVSTLQAQISALSS